MTRIDIQTTHSTEMLPITPLVQQTVDTSLIQQGICHIYVPHTTAAVTINENADPMVVHDVLHAVNSLIPLRDPEYRHMEDNSAAHVKAILFGASATVPIENARLVLGTWQGIFFCEFDGPRQRHFFVKVMAG
jgi:secondary thiamine-phosphate synthase enzyme